MRSKYKKISFDITDNEESRMSTSGGAYFKKLLTSLHMAYIGQFIPALVYVAQIYRTTQIRRHHCQGTSSPAYLPDIQISPSDKIESLENHN